MKRHDLKKATLRNLVPSLGMLLALAGPALAQSNDNGVQASGPNGFLQSKDIDDQKAMKQYINRKETDQEYQRAIREQPSAKASNDPWGNVRSTAAPTTAPAPKTAAKTASGAKSKPAGSGSAASATSATPKNQ